MAQEYKLSYTAEEIDERLGRVDYITPVIVEVTRTRDDNDGSAILTANYSCNEIIAFHNQGRNVYLRDYDCDYPLTEAYEIENEEEIVTGVMFGNVGSGEEVNCIRVYYMYGDSNDVIPDEAFFVTDIGLEYSLDGKLDKPGNNGPFTANNCYGGVLARLTNDGNPFWMTVSGGNVNVIGNSIPKYNKDGQLVANYQKTDGSYAESIVATYMDIFNHRQLQIFNIYTEDDGSFSPDDIFEDIVDVVENMPRIPALCFYANGNYKTIATVASVERDDDGNPTAVIFGDNEYIWRSDESFEKIENNPLFKSGEATDSIVHYITPEQKEDGTWKENQSTATAEAAVAIGKYSAVSGKNSMAVNYKNRVTAERAFAANEDNDVGGKRSAAFGWKNRTTENALNSFVTGNANTVDATNAFAVNCENEVHATNGFAAGFDNIIETTAENAFASGSYGVNKAKNGFSSGSYNTIDATAENGVSFGYRNTVSGPQAFSTGEQNAVSGTDAFSSGNNNTVSGSKAAAFGDSNTVTGVGAFAAGKGNEAKGEDSVAMGKAVKALGDYATAFGDGNTASGESSTAIGRWNTVSGLVGFVGGQSNNAKGDYAFVAGANNLVDTGVANASVFGLNNKVYAGGSLVAGNNNTISKTGIYATAFGSGNEIAGISAFAAGQGLKTTQNRQIAFGQFNNPMDDALLIVGNGTSAEARNNALVVKKDSIIIGDTELSAETINDVKQMIMVNELENLVNAPIAPVAVYEGAANYAVTSSGKLFCKLNDSLTTAIYEVKAGKTYEFTANALNDCATAFAFADGIYIMNWEADKWNEGKTYSNYTNETEGKYRYIITPESDCYLYIQTSSSIDPNTNLIKAKETDSPVKYSVYENGEGIELSYKYGDDMLTVRLCKRGGNNLFDFRKVFTSKEVLFDSNASDWHSPFVVRALDAVADGDNINSKYFTGGNHQNNNTYKGGTPTARGTSLDFFADGKKLSADEYGVANTIEMRWTNMVQGYNTSKADGTGREILKENHILKFVNGKFEAYVELVPLETVFISKYYGLQAVLGAYTKVRFLNGGGLTGRGEKAIPTSGTVSSGSTKTSLVKYYNDSHALIMEIDTSLDMGTKDTIFFADKSDSGSAEYGAFIANGKSYFNIINKNCCLGADQMCCLRGSWEFTPNYN